MANCKFCSASIPDDSTFCPFCGGSNPLVFVQSMENFNVEQNPVAEHPGKSKKGLVAGIIAGVIALILVAGAVLFFIFKDDIMALFDNESTSDEIYEDELTTEDFEEGKTVPAETPDDFEEEPYNEPEAPIIDPADLLTGEIYINGVLYTLGCEPISNLIADGWELSGNYDLIGYGENYETGWQTLEMGEYSISVIFDIADGEAVEDCVFYGIRVYRNNVPVEIPCSFINNAEYDGIDSALMWDSIENGEYEFGIETNYSYSYYTENCDVDLFVSCPEGENTIVYIYYTTLYK